MIKEIFVYLSSLTADDFTANVALKEVLAKVLLGKTSTEEAQKLDPKELVKELQPNSPLMQKYSSDTAGLEKMLVGMNAIAESDPSLFDTAMTPEVLAHLSKAYIEQQNSPHKTINGDFPHLDKAFGYVAENMKNVEPQNAVYNYGEYLTIIGNIKDEKVQEEALKNLDEQRDVYLKQSPNINSTADIEKLDFKKAQHSHDAKEHEEIADDAFDKIHGGLENVEPAGTKDGLKSVYQGATATIGDQATRAFAKATYTNHRVITLTKYYAEKENREREAKGEQPLASKQLSEQIDRISSDKVVLCEGMSPAVKKSYIDSSKQFIKQNGKAIAIGAGIGMAKSAVVGTAISAITTANPLAGVFASTAYAATMVGTSYVSKVFKAWRNNEPIEHGKFAKDAIMTDGPQALKDIPVVGYALAFGAKVYANYKKKSDKIRDKFKKEAKSGEEPTAEKVIDKGFVISTAVGAVATIFGLHKMLGDSGLEEAIENGVLPPDAVEKAQAITKNMKTMDEVSMCKIKEAGLMQGDIGYTANPVGIFKENGIAPAGIEQGGECLEVGMTPNPNAPKFGEIKPLDPAHPQSRELSQTAQNMMRRGDDMSVPANRAPDTSAKEWSSRGNLPYENQNPTAEPFVGGQSREIGYGANDTNKLRPLDPAHPQSRELSQTAQNMIKRGVNASKPNIEGDHSHDAWMNFDDPAKNFKPAPVAGPATEQPAPSQFVYNKQPVGVFKDDELTGVDVPKDSFDRQGSTGVFLDNPSEEPTFQKQPTEQPKAKVTEQPKSGVKKPSVGASKAYTSNLQDPKWVAEQEAKLDPIKINDGVRKIAELGNLDNFNENKIDAEVTKLINAGEYADPLKARQAVIAGMRAEQQRFAEECAKSDSELFNKLTPEQVHTIFVNSQDPEKVGKAFKELVKDINEEYGTPGSESIGELRRQGVPVALRDKNGEFIGEEAGVAGKDYKAPTAHDDVTKAEVKAEVGNFEDRIKANNGLLRPAGVPDTVKVSYTAEELAKHDPKQWVARDGVLFDRGTGKQVFFVRDEAGNQVNLDRNGNFSTGANSGPLSAEDRAELEKDVKQFREKVDTKLSEREKSNDEQTNYSMQRDKELNAKRGTPLTEQEKKMLQNSGVKLTEGQQKSLSGIDEGVASARTKELMQKENMPYNMARNVAVGEQTGSIKNGVTVDEYKTTTDTKVEGNKIITTQTEEVKGSIVGNADIDQNYVKERASYYKSRGASESMANQRAMMDARLKAVRDNATKDDR